MIKTNIFISGHRNITRSEFDTHYTKLIDQYIEWAKNKSHLGDKRLTFYVGDCEGCDKMAVFYLLDKLCDNIKLVVCSLKEEFDGQTNYDYLEENDSLNRITTIKEFNSHEERDCYMTEQTEFDILWVREGEWASGTAQNFVRRNFHKTI